MGIRPAEIIAGTRYFVLLASLFFALSPASAQIPPAVYDQAVADFDQQKYAEAERTLRAALAEHPHDARALGLMGLILDGQKRFAEAETFYRRAVELAPRDATLYSNLGNHHLEQGQAEEARAAYLHSVELDPADRNANSQLAQISVDRKEGAKALQFLGRLPKKDQALPAFQLVRAQALELTGQTSSAGALLERLLKESGHDPHVAYSVGMLFAGWKDYAHAEAAFTTALKSAPGDFDVLFNLGLAALGADDYSQAGQAFQTALDRHAGDVDCLMGLARVKDALHQDDKAVEFLFQAQRVAPDRLDLLELLGKVLGKLGLYADAALAYDHCLKAHPEDDGARRERGFALARASMLTEAFQDLNWYVEKHPLDPVGWFELAAADSVQQRERALAHFERALELDPQMASARLARAILLGQKGEYSQALADLKLVLKREPDNLRAWEELGEASLATGRTSEAVSAFEKAAGLAPRDAQVLWRYTRALMRAGQKESAEKVLAQAKGLGKSPEAPPRASSASLDLGSAGNAPASISALRQLVAANPSDWRLKLRLGEELLAEHKEPEALEVLREIKTSTSDSVAFGECGRALLLAGQYKAAREFLAKAAQADASNPQNRLDLVLAVFHDAGPEPALTILETAPPEARNGDYYLLRAQLLDALRRPRAAAEALNRGIQSTPTRPDLYLQAALFMANHGQVQQMVDFLAKADRVVPEHPQLWLTRAIGLAMLHENDPAVELLTKMESLWPEWYLPYLIHGIILAYRVLPLDAKPLLETAIALGAHQATAYYNLAYVIITSDPEDVREAQAAVREALALSPKDPYVQSLAGKIAYRGKDYPAALEHLRRALELWPDMVEAHETLSATYRALGEKEKSIEELKTVSRIKQEHPGVQFAPFPTHDLLFTVDEPSSPP